MSVILLASAAHKLHPVRMRVVNVEPDQEEWIKDAYVPSVSTEKGPSGAERSQQRRIGVLQRVIYLELRQFINSRHNGARFVDATGRELIASPRVLLYLCDKPEERAILCLKPGQCAKPCSNCNVVLLSLSSPEALTERARTIHPQHPAPTGGGRHAPVARAREAAAIKGREGHQHQQLHASTRRYERLDDGTIFAVQDHRLRCVACAFLVRSRLL